jgi:hypothetical protein
MARAMIIRGFFKSEFDATRLAGAGATIHVLLAIWGGRRSAISGGGQG